MWLVKGQLAIAPGGAKERQKVERLWKGSVLMCYMWEASPIIANLAGPPLYAPIWINKYAAVPYG